MLRSLDQWIRRRLRSVIWQQWRHCRVRFRQLSQRGVGKDLAASTVGSSHSCWRLANSPALAVALPIAYFDSLGLPRLFAGSSALLRSYLCVLTRSYPPAELN